MCNSVFIICATALRLVQTLRSGAELPVLLEACSVGERFISVYFLGLCFVLRLGL